MVCNSEPFEDRGINHLRSQELVHIFRIQIHDSERIGHERKYVVDEAFDRLRGRIRAVLDRSLRCFQLLAGT